MFRWLRSAFSHKSYRRTLRALHAPLRVRGRYDAAVTTDENRRHWANAVLLSANAANNPQVRRTLRARARYEVANNSYARGIVLTLANDCVGTGPRLQMLTEHTEANRVVEQEFMRWADSVGLPEKLRTMRMARAADGEAFCMLVANPKVDSPVKLDLRLIEADQVATPDLVRQIVKPNATDGIVFDTSDLLPLWLRTAAFRELAHQWFWDGQEHVDPAKEASAQATRLSNHTTTLAYEYARQGRDWEDALRQRAKELSLMRSLGLDTAQSQPSDSKQNDQEQEEEEDDAPAKTEE